VDKDKYTALFVQPKIRAADHF